MAAQKRQILIESILGGHATYEGIFAADEYLNSSGIDPDSPGAYSGIASAHIIPTFVGSVATFSQNTVPLWMKGNPKDGLLYVYNANGSVFSATTGGVVGLTDLNDGGTATGNGAAYLDNYMYFARSTTVARYGPLNGTPSFTDDYWVGVLGKTALTDTTYPVLNGLPNGAPTTRHPNHVMHRHRDGKLYFADVVGNQGVLHYISTTKTTVEGDTDSGSTYNAIDFPYGMYPTSIESLGDEIVVALFEGTTSAASQGAFRQTPAKLAFWNPSNPTTYRLLTGEEFPDPIIWKLINRNGVLYTFSSNLNDAYITGFRVCRYLGEASFEQVAYIDRSAPPLPGAVDGILNKLLFGSDGSILALGSKVSGISNRLTNIAAVSDTITTIVPNYGESINSQSALFTGYSTTEDVATLYQSLDDAAQEFGVSPSTSSSWTSQIYRTTGKFKITKLVVNLSESIGSSDDFSVAPYIFYDGLSTSQALTPITYANYGSSKHIVYRPSGLVGEHSFVVRFVFTGTNLNGTGVTLPVLIEYEIIDETD